MVQLIDVLFFLILLRPRSPSKEASDSAPVLHAGADVNSVKFHETALHHAARANMVDMMELLVEFGANVFASDNLGRKPIDYTDPASPSYSCLQFYESNFNEIILVPRSLL